MGLLISLLLNSIALILTAYIVPGFRVDGFTAAVLTAIVLGIVNTFIKPVLLLLTAPLTILTFGLFAFVVNAIVLWLVDLVVPGFDLEGFWAAILGAIVLSVISTILSMVVFNVATKGK